MSVTRILCPGCGFPLCYCACRKLCSTCKETKPLSSFGKDKQKADGLTSQCKSCRSVDYYAMRDNILPRLREKRAGAEFKNTRRPEQYKAHYTLCNAIKAGEVVKPSECGRCGCSCSPDAHHHDYDKPLDVEWLCRSCHMALHAAERANTKQSCGGCHD